MELLAHELTHTIQQGNSSRRVLGTSPGVEKAQRAQVTSYVLGPGNESPLYWEKDCDPERWENDEQLADEGKGNEIPKDRKGTETYRAAAEEAYGKTDILTGLSRFGLLKMPAVDGPRSGRRPQVASDRRGVHGPKEVPQGR